jgi:hypothetical protein
MAEAAWMGMRKWKARLLAGIGVLFTAVGPLGAAGQITNQIKDDPLKDVRLLYGTAAYDEALLALLEVDDSAVVDQLDEYRVLCLLALHRDAEAEDAMERLVTRHPISLDGLSEQPPKFAAVYRAIRTRLVPALAESAYRSAQDSFEARDYPAAERQFGEALELLHSVGSPAERPDLETLAAGFRALAELRKAPPEPQRVQESTSIPAAPLPFAGPEPMPPALFTPVPRMYDKTDLDVTAPVEINRTMPAWKPPSPLVANRTYAGQLQLIIGKDGRVMSADVLQPSFSTYDWLLLLAVKQWQYAPALKRGVPVEYRQTFEFSLRGSTRNSVEPNNLVSVR